MLAVLAVCGIYADQPIQPIVMSVNTGTDAAANKQIHDLLVESVVSLKNEDYPRLLKALSDIESIASAYTMSAPTTGGTQTYSQIMASYKQALANKIRTAAYVGIMQLMDYMTQIQGIAIVLHFLNNS